MVYRKGELSKARMDRQWPHQVALPAYRCLGHNFLTIHFFCQGERLSLCTRRHTYRHNDVDMTVFCFAQRDHAEKGCAPEGDVAPQAWIRAVAARIVRRPGWPF